MIDIPELLFQVFIFLTHNDLNNVSLCSRLFYSIVSEIHRNEKGIGLLNKWRYSHFFMKSFEYQNSKTIKCTEPLSYDHKLPFLSYFSDIEGLYFKVFPNFIEITTFGNPFSQFHCHWKSSE